MRMAEPRHTNRPSGPSRQHPPQVAEHEIVFEADLNGDGLIGFNLSAIETNGDYSLAQLQASIHRRSKHW